MAWTVLLLAPPVRAPSRQTPPRGKLRLLDQLIRFPVDLDQVMGGLGGGGGVNTTRVGPWGAGVTT